MAELVEVVIKIPKYYLTHPQDYSCLAECVKRGTPLSKGHGRLIDMDELLKQIEFKGFIQQNNMHLVTMDRVKNALNNASTVIETDKEVK